jgi:hypothetical protein
MYSITASQLAKQFSGCQLSHFEGRRSYVLRLKRLETDLVEWCLILRQ